jgi:hypothetical protein
MSSLKEEEEEEEKGMHKLVDFSMSVLWMCSLCFVSCGQSSPIICYA